MTNKISLTTYVMKATDERYSNRTWTARMTPRPARGRVEGEGGCRLWKRKKQKQKTNTHKHPPPKKKYNNNKQTNKNKNKNRGITSVLPLNLRNRTLHVPLSQPFQPLLFCPSLFSVSTVFLPQRSIHILFSPITLFSQYYHPKSECD